MTLSKSDLAVNSLRLQNGMLVKVRDDYYRINRVYLIHKKIKLVDVSK